MKCWFLIFPRGLDDVLSDDVLLGPLFHLFHLLLPSSVFALAKRDGVIHHVVFASQKNRRCVFFFNISFHNLVLPIHLLAQVHLPP